jgi:integrase
LSDYLVDFLKSYPKNPVYLIETKDGKPTNPHQLYKKLTKFYEALNIDKEKRLSPHELRHTCGTLLYRKTRDIFMVSRFLGHADISITTKIYVHSEFAEQDVSF